VLLHSKPTAQINCHHPNPRLHTRFPARREFETFKDPQTGRQGTGGELECSLLATRLRQLIVHLAPPRYAQPDPTQPDPTPPGMNSEQHAAVQRVLCAQDYTLVLGMPGAGKTTTIVSMVQVGGGMGWRMGRQAGQQSGAGWMGLLHAWHVPTVVWASAVLHGCLLPACGACFLVGSVY